MMRYHRLDAWRGLAVLNMVLYHAVYDYLSFQGQTQRLTQPSFVVWELLIAGSFILISGMATNLATKTFKRGLEIFLIGTAITLITISIVPEEQIHFGILSFLGASMMLTALFKKWLQRIPNGIGVLTSILLFLIVKIPLAQTMNQMGMRHLYWLGFPDAQFVSADYFPLLPWFFLFMTGRFLWGWLVEHEKTNLFIGQKTLLSKVGQWALWIYVLHQPILYFVIQKIMRS